MLQALYNLNSDSLRSLLLLLLLGLCCLISQVYQASEIDTAVVGQTDLTRPGCGGLLCAEKAL